MERAEELQRAIDWLEERMEEAIDFEELAAACACSFSRFQKLFGIFCGVSPAEYVRLRRLTLAGAYLAQNPAARVTDAAFRFGYDSADGFSRAFAAFHGCTPRQAKAGAPLNSYSRLCLKFFSIGGTMLAYKLVKREKQTLVGFKRRFSGAPCGEERAGQEENFWRTTRGLQWLLRGAAARSETDYCVIFPSDGEGYDFYIAAELDEWEREAIFDVSITGFPCASAGIERIELPAGEYAVFCTEKSRKPVKDYIGLSRRIGEEWLPSSGLRRAPLPEIVAMHWPLGERRDEKYIEIFLPVERRSE